MKDGLPAVSDVGWQRHFALPPERLPATRYWGISAGYLPRM